MPAPLVSSTRSSLPKSYSPRRRQPRPAWRGCVTEQCRAPRREPGRRWRTACSTAWTRTWPVSVLQRKTGSQRAAQLTGGVQVRGARVARHDQRSLGRPPAQPGHDGVESSEGAGGVVVGVQVDPEWAAAGGLEARVVDLVEEVL